MQQRTATLMRIISPKRYLAFTERYFALVERIVNFLLKITDRPRHMVMLFLAEGLIVSILYWIWEVKSFPDSLYWFSVTASTTGYGDLLPTTLATRLLAVFVMASCVFFWLPLITAQLASKLIVNRDVFSHEEQEALKTELQEANVKITALSGELASVVDLLHRLHSEVDEVEELAAGDRVFKEQVRQDLGVLTSWVQTQQSTEGSS